MADLGAESSVLATPAARRAIAHLRTVVGPVMFVQFASTRRVPAAMCLPLGEYQPGPRDVLLGEIDGCPYYLGSTDNGSPSPRKWALTWENGRLSRCWRVTRHLD
jgi:uncharacterized protein (DUF779 family)